MKLYILTNILLVLGSALGLQKLYYNKFVSDEFDDINVEVMEGYEPTDCRKIGVSITELI